MKYGEVVYIRLSTEDILTLLDIVERQGPVIYNRSFAEAMKHGVASLCEAARVAGLVPRHTGADYEERVTKYKRAQNPSRMTERQLRELGYHRIGPKAMDIARAKVAQIPIGQPEYGETMTAAERTRMNHLAQKRFKFTNNGEDIAKFAEFMDTEEGQELDRLMSKDQA